MGCLMQMDIWLIWPNLIIWGSIEHVLVPINSTTLWDWMPKECRTGHSKKSFHPEFSFRWCQSASSTIPPCLDLVVVNPGESSLWKSLISRGHYSVLVACASKIQVCNYILIKCIKLILPPNVVVEQPLDRSDVLDAKDFKTTAILLVALLYFKLVNRDQFPSFQVWVKGGYILVPEPHFHGKSSIYRLFPAINLQKSSGTRWPDTFDYRRVQGGAP